MSSPLKIPVDRLKAICNPLGECDIWRVGKPVTAKMVDDAFVGGRLNPNPNASEKLKTAGDHAGRIAYLAHYGWTKAISLDIGIPSLHCYPAWMIDDGNHRFAAAIYREDEFILADVGGCNDYMMELFGVNYP